VDTVAGLLSIVLINLVLSGDNALVIGMAAAPLAPARRRLAILIGGGLAIVLRIILTWVAVELLRIPAFSAVGGGLLLWIAFKLLQTEEEAAEGRREAATLGGAIPTIALADLVMSLDNVLGVAAAAHGSVLLLVLGLLLSMAIVIGGGGVIAGLIERFTWLAYVGAAVIAWTGAEMLLGDALVLEALGGGPIVGRPLAAGLLTLATLALAHSLHRRRQPRSALRKG
jgi:YjbE family integral membrane protein